MKDEKHITLRIPAALKNELAEIAREDGDSWNQAVLIGLKRYVDVRRLEAKRD